MTTKKETTKFKTHKEIADLASKLHNDNKIIVALSGSFDILHIGHIRALQEAKQQGDVLIVLLNSDKSIKCYKGSSRPINNQTIRIETLSALECVDYVTIFNELTPINTLKKIKPHILCQGSDWGENCVEREVVEKYGGDIHVLKWTKGFSTSNLVKKIIEVNSKQQIKAVFLDRDGTVNINNPAYIYRIDDFKFTPTAIAALRTLSMTDYKIIIVTNQSGIGRGFFTEKDIETLHEWMINKLKENGVRIDSIYYCPHLQKDNCSCRKPRPGMLLRAVRDFDINLSQSWLVGDDERDIVCGRKANLRTIKIGKSGNRNLTVRPNHYAANLEEAVDMIISHGSAVQQLVV